jgi:hypothetical protein
MKVSMMMNLLFQDNTRRVGKQPSFIGNSEGVDSYWITADKRLEERRVASV